jgi:hypothetical protein
MSGRSHADALSSPRAFSERGRTARRSHSTRSVEALRDAYGNPQLRLLGLAWAASTTAEGLYLVVLAVYAYGAGGALAVGIVGFARMAAAAASAALGSVVTDRFAREHVARAAEAGRALLLVGIALGVMLGEPPAIVLTLAAAHAAVSRLLRPAMKTVLPSLARTPQQLVAANAAVSAMEGAGLLAGSVAGGVLVALTGAGAGFAASSACSLTALALLLALRVEGGALRDAVQRSSQIDVLTGLRALAKASGGARMIAAAFCLQTFVRGALTVLVVVIAVDLLSLSESWVGLLAAALGAGGIVGSLGSACLAGRSRRRCCSASCSGAPRSLRSAFSRARSSPSRPSRPWGSATRCSTSPATRCCSARSRPQRSGTSSGRSSD